MINKQVLLYKVDGSTMRSAVRDLWTGNGGEESEDKELSPLSRRYFYLHPTPITSKTQVALTTSPYLASPFR